MEGQREPGMEHSTVPRTAAACQVDTGQTVILVNAETRFTENILPLDNGFESLVSVSQKNNYYEVFKS